MRLLRQKWKDGSMASLFSKIGAFLGGDMTNMLSSGCSSSGYCGTQGNCSCAYYKAQTGASSDVVVYAETSYN